MIDTNTECSFIIKSMPERMKMYHFYVKISIDMSVPKKIKIAIDILDEIIIVPYSVLGTQLTKSSRVVQKAVVPGPHCMFVDPAGLPFIQHYGPRSAGGASAEIYRFIGISDEFKFPRAVRNAIRVSGDAYYHAYNRNFHCCHVIGPDFTTMKPEPTEKAAIEMLTLAYTNIFRQFVRSHLPTLRLLPVSGGIFSGKFHNKIPSFTFIAITKAIENLKKSEYEYIRKAIAFSHKKNRFAIEMCIFADFQKTALSIKRTIV